MMINMSRYKHLIVTSSLVIYTLVTILKDFTIDVNPSQGLRVNHTLQSTLKKVQETSLFLPLKNKGLSIKKKHEPKKLKRILYWNASKDFRFCCGRGPYKRHKCPKSLCHISTDKQENLENFDAIIFHGRFLDPQDIPAVRFPHQLYVYLNSESAAYPNIIDWSPWNDFFNLTMTYRTDSDVFMPYGKIMKHAQPPRHQKNSNKTGLVSWMVSNCKTQSKRELLVKELRKYLPAESIHVYGSCGSMACSKDSRDDREECWKMLEHKYKFYLSLENSICPDYVTEKMFEALKHDIVPIVLGGADYDKTFPPHSFINMMDFKNMSTLADHLIALDNDAALYGTYLAWKTKYSVKNSRYDRNLANCDLCQALHSTDPKGFKKSFNLKKWFIDERKCQYK